MRKIINLNNIDVIIDTDRYEGVWLRGQNGMELFFRNIDLASVSRFFNLISYREDAILYLEDHGFKNRIDNEDYVVAITERYEKNMWDFGDDDWRDNLQEAFERVDYDKYKED